MATLTQLRDTVAARFERQPSWVTLIELFIGLGWLRAAVSKVIDPSWWRGQVILDFIDAQQGEALAYWEPFLTGVVEPFVVPVAAIVLLGQLFAAAALLSGRMLASGLTVAMTMNLAFVMTGAVDPSVFYLILQAVIALWLFENHVDRATGRRQLAGYFAAGVVVAVATAPQIRTLDPMEVIEDPATVLVTYATSIAVATWIARRRLAVSSVGELQDDVDAAGSGA